MSDNKPEPVTKEHRDLIRETLIRNDCPEDQADSHIERVLMDLEIDYFIKRTQFKSFFNYLCDYEADCVINNYVEDKLN